MHYYHHNYKRLKAVFSRCEDVAKDKRLFSMDCKERGFHARVVYPSQFTSRMGTARVKQEEEADTRIIAKEYYGIWKEGRNLGTKGHSPKQGLTSAKDITIMLSERVLI